MRLANAERDVVKRAQRDQLPRVGTLLARTNWLVVLTYLVAAGERTPSDVSRALDLPLPRASATLRALTDAALAERTRREPGASAVSNFYRAHPVVQVGLSSIEVHLAETEARRAA